MKPPTIIGALVCLLLSTVVSAQVRTGPFPPGQGRGAGPGRATPIDRGQLGLVAIDPYDTARAVEGVPFSAEAVTEVTQVLGDGNRIQRRTAATIARDSKGRVRRDERAILLGGTLVERALPLATISDPTTGTHITLDAEQRVAFRVTGRRANVPLRTKPGASPGAPMSPQASDVVTEKLGERSIEGVRAEGTRTTTTIPANAIGNQSPIKIVSERWYSPDLQMVVLTQRSDPRFGETVYRLLKVVRAEPAADLFEIPAGYRIEEQTLPPPPPFPAQPNDR